MDGGLKSDMEFIQDETVKILWWLQERKGGIEFNMEDAHCMAARIDSLISGLERLRGMRRDDNAKRGQAPNCS